MAEQDERREILLWAAAAGLLTAVGLCAVISAPDFAPAERVVYSRPPYTASAPLSSAVAEKINLNTASRAELLQISGIGDVTADQNPRLSGQSRRLSFPGGAAAGRRHWGEKAGGMATLSDGGIKTRDG